VLRCIKVVDRQEDDIVEATCDPIVAYLIQECPVTPEIVAGESREIGFLIPLMVAPYSPGHSRPGELHTESPFYLVTFKFHALFVYDGRLYPNKGQGGIGGFGGGYKGDGSNHDAPCFRLPPSVHNGTFLFSDDVVIPVPCLLVDRFTYGAQYP